MNGVSYKNNFDILRLSLAVCVMIFHIGCLYGNENLSLFPGGLAVHAFFIISGYLITQSFERSKTLKDYSIKRLKRIAPGLYFLIIVSVFAGIFLTKLSIIEYIKDYHLYILILTNFLFINFASNHLPGVFTENSHMHGDTFNGSLWTLRVEVFFYIFIPILYFVFRSRIIIGAIVSIILSTIIKYILIEYQTIIEINVPNFLYNGLLKEESSPFTTLSFFLSGLLLYKLKNIFEKMENLSKTFFVTTSILFLINYSYNFINIPWPIYPIILACIVIYVAIYFPFRISIPRQIGDLSYGIYIYHFPIIQTCIAFKIKLISAIPIIIISTFLCAYFSWHIIEKRFLKRN